MRSVTLGLLAILSISRIVSAFEYRYVDGDDDDEQGLDLSRRGDIPDEYLSGHTERKLEVRKKKKKGGGGLNLGKGNDRDYVRFYLSKSIKDWKPGMIPIVIDIPYCMDFIKGGDYDWTDDSVYRAYFKNASIKTHPLNVGKAEDTRNCQTFRIEPVSHVSKDETTGVKGGSVIGIAAPNQTSKNLGLSSPNGGIPQWYPDIDPNGNYTHRFLVNCNAYGKHLKNTPEYQWWYGRKCNIRIIDSAGSKNCWAAGTEANSTGMIRTLPCSGDDPEQLFHLGIASLEFPNYYDVPPASGGSTDGPLYGKDPMSIFTDAHADDSVP